MSTPDEAPDAPASPESSTPLEPFLLAGDPDLEEVVHETDPTGSLYLRPYSRVYLADKWTVLGVPNVVVYHVESQKVLTYHARFELLKEHKADATWEKWSKGEKVEFGVGGASFTPLAVCRAHTGTDFPSLAVESSRPLPRPAVVHRPRSHRLGLRHRRPDRLH